MTLFMYLLLLCLGAGAVFGMVWHRRGGRQGLVLTGACTALVVGVAAWSLRSVPPDLQQMQDNAQVFVRLSGRVLGEHLSRTMPGARILVMVPPPFGQGEAGAGERILLDGLRSGLSGGARINQVVAPSVPAWFREQVEAMVNEGELAAQDTPMVLIRYEQWLTAEVFAETLRSYEESADVLVSTVALTPDAVQDSRLPIVFLDAPGCRVSLPMFKDKVKAAVLLRPNPRSWTVVRDLPRDHQEAFRLRYLLITPDNAESINQDYPGLFYE